MITDPKHKLRDLIDQLTDDDAAAALAYVEQLIAPLWLIPLAPDGGPLVPHEPPVLHRGFVITDAAQLQGDVFPPEEDADEFIATIRRWREEGQPE